MPSVVAAGTSEAVLSDLLIELRTLTARLDAGQLESMLNYDSSDSDSDDEREPTSRSSKKATTSQATRPTSSQPHRQQQDIPQALRQALSLNSCTLVVQGLSGTVEIPVPELDSSTSQGWDEDDFAAKQFQGSGRVMVCQGSKCRGKGALDVLHAVSALSTNSPGIEVLPCKCLGKCKQGAAMRVRTEGQKDEVYTELTPQQLPAIFDAHFSAPAAPVEQPAGNGVELSMQ